MKKIIVFASGGGSNFEVLANACERGEIDGEIVSLVVSRPGIGAIGRAGQFSIPVFMEGSGDLLQLLRNVKPDLICLAGYLKKVPAEILQICPVLNIHPALLPAHGGKGMYGLRVHEAALKSGASYSGVTVHFVNENYDEGKIIAQIKVPILPGDNPRTLSARVREEEHRLYPKVVKDILNEN